MRLTILARTGAALTGSALAVALAFVPAAAEAPDATLTAFRMSSSVITSADTSYARGDVGVTLATGVTPTYGTYPYAGQGFPGEATLTLRGVDRGRIPIYFTADDEVYPGVDIRRTLGSGAARLSDVVVFTTKDGVASSTSVGGTSNTFYVRKNIKVMRGDNDGLLINRVDGTVSFRARSIRIINPSTGRYVSAGSVKLQYRSGGTWRTQKTIRLNSHGDGTYRLSTSSKHRYRLHISRTSTRVEFRTQASDPI